MSQRSDPSTAAMSLCDSPSGGGKYGSTHLRTAPSSMPVKMVRSSPEEHPMYGFVFTCGARGAQRPGCKAAHQTTVIHAGSFSRSLNHTKQGQFRWVRVARRAHGAHLDQPDVEVLVHQEVPAKHLRAPRTAVRRAPGDTKRKLSRSYREAKKKGEAIEKPKRKTNGCAPPLPQRGAARAGAGTSKVFFSRFGFSFFHTAFKNATFHEDDCPRRR